MPPNFDWHSEEEGAEWEEETAVSRSGSRNHHRRWLIPLLLALGIVGTFLLHKANQQIIETTAAIEDDVLSMHNLLRDAASRQDLELFITGLSGRDPKWVDAEQQLVQQGSFLARPAFDLTVSVADLQPVVSATITLSPDLATAEFSFDQQYQTRDDAGFTRTVTLRHTDIYRRGVNHWLFAPPDAEFWGKWLTTTGTHITLQYPERDAALAVRLLQDLDTKIDDLCRYPGLDCPDDFALSVQFGTKPVLLADLQNERTLWHAQVGRLYLPTPTLVGIPVDDAGYASLQRGYANQVLTAVVSDLVDYTCCQGQLYYHALLDKLLSEVGVRRWPLTDADYDLLLNAGTNLTTALVQVRQTWDMPLSAALAQDEWQQAYALVAFALTSEPTIATPTMLVPRDQVDEWIRPFTTDNPVFADSLLPPPGAWVQFVYQHAVVNQPDPPIALPDQQVQLTCLGSLYRYDLAEAKLTLVDDTLMIEQMTPLADDSGVLIQGQQRDSDMQIVWQAALWRNGQRQVVYERPYLPDSSFFAASLQQEYLLILAVDIQPSDNWRGVTFSYFDLNTCSATDCEERPLSDITTWSPDTQHTLVWQLSDVRLSEHQATEIWLGDASGQPYVQIGSGYSLTDQWIDNMHYVFLRQPDMDPAERELWIGQIDEDHPRQILTAADLETTLPEGMAPSSLWMMAVNTVPGHPDLLWIATRESGGTPFANLYYFMLNWRTGEISFQYHPEAEFSSLQTVLSPGGRWAAQYLSADLSVRSSVFSSRSSDFDSVLYLYNLSSGENWSVGNPNAAAFLFEQDASSVLDWSSDGNWLLSPAENGFWLIAPDYKYQHRVVTGYPSCTAVAWSNE